MSLSEVAVHRLSWLVQLIIPSYITSMSGTLGKYACLCFSEGGPAFRGCSRTVVQWSLRWRDAIVIRTVRWLGKLVSDMDRPAQAN